MRSHKTRSEAQETILLIIQKKIELLPSILEDSRIYTPQIAWIGQTLRKFAYYFEK